jgi:hypothetical protein
MKIEIGRIELVDKDGDKRTIVFEEEEKELYIRGFEYWKGEFDRLQTELSSEIFWNKLLTGVLIVVILLAIVFG